MESMMHKDDTTNLAALSIGLLSANYNLAKAVFHTQWKVVAQQRTDTVGLCLRSRAGCTITSLRSHWIIINWIIAANGTSAKTGTFDGVPTKTVEGTWLHTQIWGATLMSDVFHL